MSELELTALYLLSLANGNTTGYAKVHFPPQLKQLLDDYQVFAKFQGAKHQSYEKVILRLCSYGAAQMIEEMKGE